MSKQLTMEQKRLLKKGFECLNKIDTLLDEIEAKATAANKKAA